MKLTTAQLRKLIKEELASAMGGKDPQRFLHGHESGHPNDDEGYMVKLRLVAIKKMAAEICELVEMGDQFPGWVQDHIAVAHENLHQVHGYLTGDEAIRQYAEKQPGTVSVAEALKRIDEGHLRITAEEISAWRSGDWGFMSEAETHDKDPDEIPGATAADYEECKICGFDHRYDPADALASHKAKNKPM